MIDGAAIREALESRGAAGASPDDLLRMAVKLIEASEEHYDWVGIYLLDGDELLLHNYIGKPTEHTRIQVGEGVVGTAVAEGTDLNIPDVHAIDNYLACSVKTASELVVLIRDPSDGRIHGQLDLDSDQRAAFTPRDEAELRRVADLLATLFGPE